MNNIDKATPKLYAWQLTCVEGIDIDRAEKIVRAVNNHNQLLEACKKAVSVIDYFQKKQEKEFGHVEPNAERDLSDIEQAIKQAEG